MKVLMFGWEFPPYKSGGLGTVCQWLTSALSKQDVAITFVMPHCEGSQTKDFGKLVGTKGFTHVKVRKVDALLTPYCSADEYITLKGGTTGGNIYGKDLYQEVLRFSEIAKTIAEEEDFDIIHAHDWMTFDAGINARTVSGKPLILHIHNTAFDRGGGHANDYEYAIEKRGFDAADKIIAISNFVKDRLVNQYFTEPAKIEVVHWGMPALEHDTSSAIDFKNDKIVLSLGRLTLQKGIDYFIEAARKVLDHVPNTKFIIVGEGDMRDQLINRALELGMADQVHFTGWLKGADVYKAYKSAHLYVMPSVAEPFGVVALEALKSNTPVLISKQSGAAEVINHALKTDFWDVDKMANMMVHVLKHDALHEELRDNGSKEVEMLTFDNTATKIKSIYEEVLPW